MDTSVVRSLVGYCTLVAWATGDILTVDGFKPRCVFCGQRPALVKPLLLCAACFVRWSPGRAQQKGGET